MTTNLPGYLGKLLRGDLSSGQWWYEPLNPEYVRNFLCGSGLVARYVAYHRVAGLEVAERERAERDLIAHYLDARRSLGGPVPTEAEAWDAYRDALAYGYYMWGITRRVDRPIILAFVERLGSAVEFHDTFARLGV